MENISEIELYKQIRRTTPMNKNYNGLPLHIREDVIMNTFEKSVKKLRDGIIEGQWEDGLKNYVFIIGLNETRLQLSKIKRINDVFVNVIKTENGFEPINFDELADTPNEELSDTNTELYYWINLIKDENVKEIIYLVLSGYTLRESSKIIVKGNNLTCTDKSLQTKYYKELTWIKDRLNGKPERYYKYRVINTITTNITHHVDIRSVAKEIGISRHHCYSYINWGDDFVKIKEYKITKI